MTRQRGAPQAVTLAAAWLVALTLGACAPSVEIPELPAVPAPDLSSAEEPVASQVAEARQALDEARLAAESLVRVADAYGSLGEIYHAYELWRPAAVAYANAATLDPRNAVWPFLSGLVAHEQGDFAAARDHFRRAVELQPTMDAARLRLAESLLALGETGAAGDEAARLAARPGFEVAAHWLRGRAAAAAGDDQAAVEQFRAVLERAPSADVVHRSLGLSLRRLGLDAEAGAHLEHEGKGQVPYPDPLLERILGLARTAGAYLRRGNQELVAERPERAAEEFRRGLEVAPDHLELRLNLGLALARAGRPADAAEAFREAVRRHPDSARAHHDLGSALRAAGRSAEAIEALRRATELQPDYPSAWFNLANALSGEERWPQAEEAARRHLQLQPGDRRSAYLLAMAQHGQGRGDEAAKRLRALLDEDPKDVVTRRGLATVLTTMGRAAEVGELWHQIADLELPVAERGRLLDAGARDLWRLGRRQQAVGLWRDWARIAPGSSPAHTALANGLQLLGRRQEAQEQFARAAALDPQNATAWHSEISLRVLGGDFAGAARRADEAMAIHPEHPGLLDVTARLLATAPEPSLRDGARALDLAIRLRRIEPTNPQYPETLAMALAEAGHFDRAVQLQTSLARQAQARGDRQALARLVTNLRRYEQGLPVRVQAP